MGTLWLNAISHDYTSRIQPFAQTLFQYFTAAGFLVAGQIPLTLSLRIIEMHRVKNRVPSHNPWVRKLIGYNTTLARKLDARMLSEKYKDYEWAADIRLEKLSICEGVYKDSCEGGRIVGQKFRDIASIPLP